MISDEELILYFYADGLSNSRREYIDRKLKQDAELARRYMLLKEDLSRLGELAGEEVPQVDKTPWRLALDEHINSDAGLTDKSDRARASTGYPIAVAIAASVLVFVSGVIIGGKMSSESNDDERPFRTVAQEAPAPVSDSLPQGISSFERGIATHLQATQIQLASLDMSNQIERSELVENIISQNQFFLQAANENGAHDVARLLRAFEPLLRSLATESDSAAAPSAETIRAQLEFELDVSLTKFGGQSSKRTYEF